MQYTNFQVGEKFPLPIQSQGDGGLFQIDINGAMFILQLSRTDVIAVEAFRTGRMELALCIAYSACSTAARACQNDRSVPAALSHRYAPAAAARHAQGQAGARLFRPAAKAYAKAA